MKHSTYHRQQTEGPVGPRLSRSLQVWTAKTLSSARKKQTFNLAKDRTKFRSFRRASIEVLPSQGTIQENQAFGVLCAAATVSSDSSIWYLVHLNFQKRLQTILFVAVAVLRMVLHVHDAKVLQTSRCEGSKYYWLLIQISAPRSSLEPPN